MNTKIFLKNFGHIADTPNGVQELRELILELSIQGKLTAQNANEESGYIVFENIQKKREKLIQSGEIKRQKNLPEIDSEDITFIIPDRWKCCRLGDVTNYGISDKAEPSDIHDETWVLGLEDVEKITSKLLQKVYYRDRQSKSTKSKFVSGDVIYGKLRPYLDKVIVADENGVCTTEMIPVHGYSGIVPEYLRWVMKSPYFISYADNSTHGMNLPRLGTDKGREALFPLPPLEEQKRIVTKVDQLMALCDQLETQQKQKAQTRVALNNAALDKLLTAQTHGEFNHHWQRIANNFHHLYDNLENLNRFRSAILALAVQGKLSTQDKGDEAADQLLNKIRSKKDRMIKEKVIRKAKLDLDSSEIESKELPNGWASAYMQDITSVITCGIASTPKYHEKGKIFLSAKNVKPYKFKPEEHKFVDEETYRKIVSWGAKPEKGDVLLTRVGAGIGEAAIVDQDIDFAYYVSLTLIKPIQPYIYPKYLLHWVNSPEGVNKALENIYGRGVSQGNLNVNQVRKFVVPIPPLEEQKRIVAKVDQLMALCDQLETKLKQTHTTSERLVKATVKSLVAA